LSEYAGDAGGRSRWRRHTDVVGKFLASLAGIRHEILALWEVEDGTVVAMMDVHYRRHDGREHTLPRSNLFRLRDGKVYDYRIDMDVNPVFAD
jgi:hypothetical protein